jgi:hypothetical protein
MFICNKCLTNYETITYVWMYPLSYGPCEDCGKTATCTDINHRELKLRAQDESADGSNYSNNLE